MNDVHAFAFEEPTTRTNGVAKVVEVPSSTTTKDELISLLAKALIVPDYLGGNWDALDECLRDLSWLKERVIVIKHEGLPRLPLDVLRTYLDILAGAVQSWRGENEHEVVVTFPASARNEIVRIVQGLMPSRDREPPG